MRRILAGATLVLVAATMTACGGENDAESEDNVAAFCDANKLADEAEDLESLQEAVDEIDDTLLDDMSDDEKDGFGLVRDYAKDAEDEEDFAKLVQDVEEDDQKLVDAYSSYLEKTCPEESGEDSGSDSEE